MFMSRHAGVQDNANKTVVTSVDCCMMIGVSVMNPISTTLPPINMDARRPLCQEESSLPTGSVHFQVWWWQGTKIMQLALTEKLYGLPVLLSRPQNHSLLGERWVSCQLRAIATSARSGAKTTRRRGEVQ